MTEEYTTYDAVVDAVRCHSRADRDPGSAAQAMMRAVRVLQQTHSEAEIVALAADYKAWDRAVSLYVRQGHLNVLDVHLSREIIPMLITAIDENDAEVQAPAPIPAVKGRHFADKLAARMTAA
ncbi:hypothetical protein [Rhizobium sp. RU36D]|uniref:hypothetical protein n=1 Tax=Rhizobium sp. RU36D TaxID=1907415 RepID=UPI0009D8C30D|nr:hypothetical protein [Rhizobium sp. RU36D]SMD16331.1 hypothetical protein SAMN05880593_12945 [Rhizobium sp. RU36D]